MAYRLDHNQFTQDICSLLSRLSVETSDTSLYEQAFVHRSVLNESYTHFTHHNERLEFLWDAVLELVMTDMLYKKFPDKPEGWLTDLRSSIVRGKNLAKIAEKLNFWNFLLLSKGEKQAGGTKNPSLLADVFEAFIGAVYLDLGIESSFQFIADYVYVTLDEILALKLHVDPKTELQEMIQAKYGTTPVYAMKKETGLDHEKVFTIQVELSGSTIGSGTGTSKKKAQESAAMNAISHKDTWF